jgi:hypothetical protein
METYVNHAIILVTLACFAQLISALTASMVPIYKEGNATLAKLTTQIACSAHQGLYAQNVYHQNTLNLTVNAKNARLMEISTAHNAQPNSAVLSAKRMTTILK